MRLSSLFPLAAFAFSLLVLPSSAFAASKPTNLTEAGFFLVGVGNASVTLEDETLKQVPYASLSRACTSSSLELLACKYFDPDGDLACWTGPHSITLRGNDMDDPEKKDREFIVDTYHSMKPSVDWTAAVGVYFRNATKPGEAKVVAPCSPHDRLNSNPWLFWSLKLSLEQTYAATAAFFARQQSYLDHFLSTAHNPVFCYLFGFLCGFFLNCNLRPRPPAQSRETRKN